jgi:hypothetical protein
LREEAAKSSPAEERKELEAWAVLARALFQANEFVFVD